MVTLTLGKTERDALEEKIADYIANYGTLREPLDCLILAHELLDIILPKPELDIQGD